MNIYSKGLEMFKDANGLTTQALGDTKVDELKFNDTVGTIGILSLGELIGEGENPLTNINEMGVDTSPRHSPNLDILVLKGTLTLGEPKERTCTKTRPLKSIIGGL